MQNKQLFLQALNHSMMNVGILYPRSKAYPGISKDFMDGIKACLGQGPETRINLVSEAVGFGGSEKEVYEKAEKLLLIEEVDVLIAYIGEKVIEILYPLLQSTGKLLLVVHPGANYPGSWIPQPNIIHLTLQDAFLCWLCGKDAAKTAKADGVVASTFYDCGYLHISTMVNGFTDAGGNVVFNYINKGAYDNSFHMDELENFLQGTAAPGKLLCVFDELPASLFYDKLNSFAGAAGLDLFVSPMMLQPAALADAGAGFRFSINGYSPWLAGAQMGNNKAMYEAYLLKNQNEPNLFSLLGWETGMILKQVADTCSSGYEDGAAIVSALQQVKFNGPRGEMILDAHTHYFLAPFVQCSIPNNAGMMTTEIQVFPAEAWISYIQLPTEGAASGWTNTYLCY